jgi:predicted Zn-dependent protease
VALVVTAVAACLWLAGTLRSLDRAQDAIAVVAEADARPDALAAASRDFERARRFGDDADLLLKQSQALVYGRRPKRAVPLLERAVRDEPENVGAWVLLAGAARKHDPRLSRLARSRAIALDPLAQRYLDR